MPPELGREVVGHQQVVHRWSPAPPRDGPRPLASNATVTAPETCARWSIELGAHQRVGIVGHGDEQVVVAEPTGGPHGVGPHERIGVGQSPRQRRADRLSDRRRDELPSTTSALRRR